MNITEWPRREDFWHNRNDHFNNDLIVNSKAGIVLGGGDFVNMEIEFAKEKQHDYLIRFL